MDADCGGWIFLELCSGTNRAPDEFAATIGANETKRFGCALQTEGALECADVSFAGVRRQVPVTAFAIWT